ncbi:hypothetical protein [Bacillus toyonensis]|uniref:hypothetical protein n=1 Tax=Bacillus toyonensis TaxID=155322 RepID=UPI001C031EED|nr:hypothetical protein [Bacillus toyonensis]UFH99688.1 hypothetical protein HQN46_0010210 [Bacillus toyonensis]
MTNYKGEGTIHRGGPRTPEGKAKALKNLTPGNYIHGLYLKDFKADLTEEEINWYDNLMEHYQENYSLDPLDIETLDLALVELIKSRRKNGNSMEYALNEKVSSVDFQNRYLKLIDSLGLARKYRLSKGNAENKSEIDLSMFFDGMDKK